MNKTCLVVVILGALAWGLIGIFNWNPMNWMFGGLNTVSRIIYAIVAIAGIWCIGLLFRVRKSVTDHH